jgi:GT2 family glycosyltransferase/glycosyltransferase involved in cell wall biosynthesis
MSTKPSSLKSVTAYTLYAWDHAYPYLRLVSPWQEAGVQLEKGTHWDQVSTDSIAQSDLVHIHRDFPRLWSAYQAVVETAHALNKPVVLDLDDLLLELPDDHPDRRFHYLSDALFPVLQAIVEADAVTVCTPGLYEKITPLNPNTWLLPTCLDDTLWEMNTIETGESSLPLDIGWVNDQFIPGSDSNFISGVSNFLRQQGPRVLLRIWGKKPHQDLLQLTNVDWLPEIPRDYPGYASHLSQQHCDIFLTPHGDSPYSHCQNPLRYLEQAAWGAPGIYSRLSPYQEAIEHKRNGMLASRAQEWETALSELAASPALRQQIVASAQESVRREWLLSQKAQLWLALLEQAPGLAAQRKENQAVIDQVKQVTNQARRWQRDLQQHLYDRDWEVDALNVMMRRKERESSEYIDQLGAQLQSIWDDPAWRLLHKAKRLVQVVSPPRSSPQAASLQTSLPTQVERALDEDQFFWGLGDAFPHTRTFDVIYLASEKWESLPIHQQGLISDLAQQGSRVFLVSQNETPEARPGLHQVQQGIYALILPPASRTSADGNLTDAVQVGLYRQWFDQLRHQAEIHTAICWLGNPSWADLAFILRNAFGWKIVYSPPVSASDSGEDNAIRLRSDLVLDAPLEEGNFQATMSNLQELFPKASLIILTYNNLDYTRQCLESIYAKTAYPNYEVIVVDNASTDGTPDYLQSFTASRNNLLLILNHENRGFSTGNNQGVNAASGDYIVFLNNDIVVTPGWLAGLLAHLRDPEVGAVGPVTNFAGNESRISVDYSDVTGLDAFARHYCAVHAGETFEIRMLALFCMAVRRSIIESVGPLDEQFGVGMYEDDDFSLRMRQKGYRILCAEDVYIHHWGSASFSKLAEERYLRLHEENRRKFEEKWGTQWQPPRWRMDSE